MLSSIVIEVNLALNSFLRRKLEEWMIFKKLLKIVK
jgi:hypothetical protein